MKERYRLAVFGEAFNLLNIANLTGYSGTLDAVKIAADLRVRAAEQPRQPGVRFRRTARVSVRSAVFVLICCDCCRTSHEETSLFRSF